VDPALNGIISPAYQCRLPTSRKNCPTCSGVEPDREIDRPPNTDPNPTIGAVPLVGNSDALSAAYSDLCNICNQNLCDRPRFTRQSNVTLDVWTGLVLDLKCENLSFGKQNNNCQHFCAGCSCTQRHLVKGYPTAQARLTSNSKNYLPLATTFVPKFRRIRNRARTSPWSQNFLPCQSLNSLPTQQLLRWVLTNTTTVRCVFLPYQQVSISSRS